MTDTADPHAGYVRVYKDVGRQWRFQRVASNGQVTSVSGEGFRRKRHAITMARKLFGDDVEIRVEEPT